MQTPESPTPRDENNGAAYDVVPPDALKFPPAAIMETPGLVRDLPPADDGDRKARALAMAKAAFDDAANVFVKAFSIMATASYLAKHPDARMDRARVRETEEKAHEAMCESVRRTLAKASEKPDSQVGMDLLLRKCWWGLERELKNW